MNENHFNSLSLSSYSLNEHPSTPSLDIFQRSQSYNPFKPPIYQSLTGSHGPMSNNMGTFSQAVNQHSQKYQQFSSDQQLNQILIDESKENSNIQSNQGLTRKSCPNQNFRSSVLSNGAASSKTVLTGRFSCNNSNKAAGADTTSSCAGQSSRSSSNAFKGDRFIPFRGTQDNFLEEFIINNDIYKEQRKMKNLPGDETSNSQQNRNNEQQANNVHANQDQSNYSSNTSTESNTQYSQGSGHKKKQSFQQLITESLFTNRRGSPNTLSIKEAEEEENRYAKISQNEGCRQFTSDQRILSFKEKKSKPSLSLQKNLSLITAIAQEKTQIQQKSLRCIPQFPEKILDAPDLVDDYYLNLLDWSHQNILAVCLAQTVYLWNAESGEIKQLFDTENDNEIVTSVSWMKQTGSNILAIGTSTKQVHLWDTNTFQSIRVVEGQHDGRISSLSWNPLHQSLLSSGSLDSLIHNNDLRIPTSQSLVSTFKAHRQEVCGLKWSHDGSQLASGGNDNLLCIWDINNRMRGLQNPNTFSQSSSNVYGPKFCFTDHKAAVKALSWCPWQKNLLASGGGSRDQCIKFWNSESGQLINSVQTDSQVCSLQWNPYEKEILSSHGFINNQLCIWKYPTMKKIADLRGHTSRVLHLALSPDGTTVASAAADETLRFWKVFQPTANSLSKLQNGLLSINGANSDTIMTDCSKLFQTSNVGGCFGPSLNLR